MKKIAIYPIRSMMSHENMISVDSQKLLSDLKEKLPDYDFLFLSSPSELGQGDLSLILVQSGGSEGFFLKDVYPAFNGPYYLLTYGSCNSLAASLEILTFLKDRNEPSEVLHGDIDYIVSRIKSLLETKQNEAGERLGILGKPSDWLISSHVDKDGCKEKLGIDLIEIPESKVIEAIQNVELEAIHGVDRYDFDRKEVRKALQIYEGLKKIIEEYRLDGFTIRCFDILSAVHSSACLALALFNRDGVLATCEGDVPAMLTAYLVLKQFGYHCFQANPQWIDPKRNVIELAHCTLPLDMADSYVLDTHFESGIGIGIHGEMRVGDVTILKISSSLNEFYVEEGKLETNEYRKDRCRTQIKIQLDSSVTYFLHSSLGNHHQILYGRHKNEIKEYLISLGMRNVVA